MQPPCPFVGSLGHKNPIYPHPRNGNDRTSLDGKIWGSNLKSLPPAGFVNDRDRNRWFISPFFMGRKQATYIGVKIIQLVSTSRTSQ